MAGECRGLEVGWLSSPLFETVKQLHELKVLHPKRQIYIKDIHFKKDFTPRAEAALRSPVTTPGTKSLLVGGGTTLKTTGSSRCIRVLGWTVRSWGDERKGRWCVCVGGGTCKDVSPTNQAAVRKPGTQIKAEQVPPVGWRNNPFMHEYTSSFSSEPVSAVPQSLVTVCVLFFGDVRC